MTDSDMKQDLLIDYSLQNDIGLMEKICTQGKADVLFKTSGKINLPVQLLKIKDNVSFVSRGSKCEASAGFYVASYKTPDAVLGSYFVAVLRDPLTIQQLCRAYCKAMSKDNKEAQSVFSLPFAEEILKLHPGVLDMSSLCPSERMGVSEVKALKDVNYKIGNKEFHYKAGSRVFVLNAFEIERMSMYYYKTASKKRELKEILHALPTVQVSKRSITELVDFSKKATVLFKDLNGKYVKRILRLNEDTGIAIVNPQRPNVRLFLYLKKGQTIALLPSNYPKIETLSHILPEDLRDLMVKLRYCKYLDHVNKLSSYARKGLRTIQSICKAKENQRN